MYIIITTTRYKYTTDNMTKILEQGTKQTNIIRLILP